ncbi:helix-turn-helix domain-containing protein [Mycolicibacterium sphagni]|uniref:helix-turn-helix domain-containing protein n=1 Tax=Mycolicibacterium sphagni TaxID=1786 RepID=UPI001A9C69B3|nr:helix-turn-helix transcriptional regulator [Mycolicibacterium sphagni]MCV7178629.1 helix-turn-helix transcriptional regulator [Mycolicibacterium sphagni]
MRQLIRIVQTYMDEYGVSEAEVARRIGATPQTVNSWRNGEMKQLPRQRYLRGLAEVTHTDYATVLAAALADTGYLSEPIRVDTNFGVLIVSLAVDADELVPAAAEIDTAVDTSDAEAVKATLAAVKNLVNEVDVVRETIRNAAAQVVGGDDSRLRQLKREIRRNRREQTDLRRVDISFGADRGARPDADGPASATRGAGEPQ